MPLPFPYAPIVYPGSLSLGERVRLDASQAEALRFRLVNVKEAFTLQGPHGRFYRASLLSASASGAEAVVYEAMPRSPESPLEMTLFCAVLNRQRMLLVTQKATELGVTRLQPLFSAHSVGPQGLEHEKAHAWPGAALRAVRQCRRASVPEVLPSLWLSEALAGDLWRSSAVRYYLDDRAGTAAEGVRLERGPRSVSLAVGPEGGWSDDERRMLAEAGAEPLVLGGRVLRAETAVLAGLTLVQHCLGDLLP